VFTDQYATLFLLANGLAVLLYIAARKKNKQRAMKFGNFKTLEKVSEQSMLKSSNVILVLRMLALTALMIAISNPVLIDQEITSESDYVLAIDSSSSMLTADVDPSRLEASKELSSEFIMSLPNGTSTGVLSFSGSVNRMSGLTDDRGSAAAAVSNISVSAEAGTATADAVRVGAGILTGSSRQKNLILIGDGGSNIGNLSKAIEFSNRNNVTVNTVGIGTEKETEKEFEVVNGQNGTYSGHPDLMEENLRQIADETNGTYIRAENRSALQEGLVEITEGEVRHDVSRYFVLLAVLLVMGEWVIGSTKYSILP
jgi:Ca-activated chloride channel family protein